MRITSAEFSTGASGIQPSSGISIFDCPEQIQTSPTRTFAYSTDSSPEKIFTANGPPASGVCSFSLHAPFASALVSAFSPQLAAADTSASGDAFPQTETRVFRLKTMLSEKIAGSSRLPLCPIITIEMKNTVLKNNFLIIKVPLFRFHYILFPSCLAALHRKRLSLSILYFHRCSQRSTAQG